MYKSEKNGLPRVIHTSRLVVRIPQLHDTQILYDGIMGSFDSLKRWLPWVEDYQERGVALASETIKRFESEFLVRDGYNFICFSGDDFVGMVGLMRPKEDDKSIELGYWCIVQQQGKGYITEAVNALIDYAFTHLERKKVVIICDELNSKSAAVARRLNFTLVEKAMDIGQCAGCMYEKYEKRAS